MKKLLRKLISTFMAITLLYISTSAGLIITANAAATTSGVCGAEGDNISWNLDVETGRLTLNGSGKMMDYSYGDAPWYDIFYYGYKKVKSVSVSEGISHLGNCCFYYLINLTTVHLPNSLKSIGEHAFDDCNKLETINLPENLESIQNSAFSECRSITSLVLPSNLINIYGSAFQYCSGLQDIIIPDKVQYIGPRCFLSCSGVKHITIGKGVQTIRADAFWKCSSLEALDYYAINAECPDSDYGIFSDCGKYSLYIDKDVESYDSVFANAVNLVYESSTPIYLHNGSFQTVSIGSNTTGVTRLGNYDLEKIVVDSGNKYLSSENGVLFNKDKTELIIYPHKRTAKRYDIPNGVKRISEISTLSGDSLEELGIPESYIEENLRNAIFSSTLSSVFVSDNNPCYSSKDGVLYNKNRTSLLLYPCKQKSDAFEIPVSVNTISVYAFKEALLTSLTIPNTISSIEDYALYGLQVSDIYYNGTISQWDEIYIGKGNDILESATLHYLAENPTNKLFSVYSFCNNPKLMLGTGNRLKVIFEMDCYDFENPAYLVDGTYTFTSSDTGVFTVENISNENGNTSIEIMGEGPGVAILTITGYYNGEFVCGAQYRVIVDGMLVYNAESISDSPGLNVYCDDIIIDEFIYDCEGNVCNISFDAYNQENCYGAVEVYDKNGILMQSHSISPYKGNAPTGLWDAVKKSYKLSKIDDNSFRSELWSAKSSINLYGVPVDGYVVVSNDILASDSCSVYNTSYLMTEIACTLLSEFLPSDSEEDTQTKIIQQLSKQIIDGFSSQKGVISNFKKIVEKIFSESSFGNEEVICENIEEAILYIEEMGIDIGSIVLDVAKESIGSSVIKMAENVIYSALGVPGKLAKTGFKLLSIGTLAECAETVFENTGNDKVTFYCSGTPDGFLYSNGYMILDRAQFDNDVSFHQYKIVNGSSYDNATKTFIDERFVRVVGMTLYKDGKEVQPTQQVEVAIPLPQGIKFSSVHIYREEADGSFTELQCLVENGYIYITTEHFSVYCIVGEPIAVTGLSLLDTEKVITINGTYLLRPEIMPINAANQEVIFYSSDPSIATVNSYGMVLGKKIGMAIITATTVDCGKTAICAVTVLAPTVLINNLNNSASINYGDTLKLTTITTNLPTGAYVEWSVEGNSVTIEQTATGDTCRVTSTGKGTVTVTATVVDASGNPILNNGSKITSSQTITSKAGFFQKLISFFKNLFGANRIIAQAFKQGGLLYFMAVQIVSDGNKNQ